MKRGLGSLGYWDEPAHGLNGIIDRALDTGIKDFQSDHELRVDGWMRPGGPTEGALRTRLASADRLRYPDIRVKPGRSWQSKGWGGPRGPFAVPTLRNEKERIDSILADRACITVRRTTARRRLRGRQMTSSRWRIRRSTSSLVL